MSKWFAANSDSDSSSSSSDNEDEQKGFPTQQPQAFMVRILHIQKYSFGQIPEFTVKKLFAEQRLH